MWVALLGWGQWEVNGKLLWRLKEHADLVEPCELDTREGGRQATTGAIPHTHTTVQVTMSSEILLLLLPILLARLQIILFHRAFTLHQAAAQTSQF